jgi:hypothetical protein
MKKPTGYILYEGPSVLDGSPIVLIATGFAGSANPKTGSMIQTWILRSDMHPEEAKATGQDYAICGNCPHRKFNNTEDGLIPAMGSCYVNFFAPAAVYKAYKAGSYARITDFSVFNRLPLRIGAYGDPAAVPSEFWTEAILRSEFHTGYTHQWRNPAAVWLRGIVQASCDGMADYLEATAHGWKTFHVVSADAERIPNTAHCAASAEMGKKTTCSQCRLCDGATTNVVIQAHGSIGRRFQSVA